MESGSSCCRHPPKLTTLTRGRQDAGAAPYRKFTSLRSRFIEAGPSAKCPLLAHVVVPLQFHEPLFVFR